MGTPGAISSWVCIVADRGVAMQGGGVPMGLQSETPPCQQMVPGQALSSTYAGISTGLRIAMLRLYLDLAEDEVTRSLIMVRQRWILDAQPQAL